MVRERKRKGMAGGMRTYRWDDERRMSGFLEYSEFAQ